MEHRWQKHLKQKIKKKLSKALTMTFCDLKLSHFQNFENQTQSASAEISLTKLTS